jgi:diguanylate cyclase (GGDEF)-like protein
LSKKLENFLNSGWDFSETEIFLRHRYNMVNVTLFFAVLGLIQGVVYNLRSDYFMLVYIEIGMFFVAGLIVWLLRQSKQNFGIVTSTLALITLLFFDILILFSQPEDFKFIWLFVYSTVFIFFKGNREGAIWLALMYLSLVVLVFQPFVALHYSGGQLLYFVIVSLILNGIVMLFQSMMESSQRLVLEQKQQLEAQNQALQHLSITDPLTQLNNRLKLDEAINYELERANRYGAGFSLIMIDIDYFKEVNDTYGHQAGDDVLVAVAQLIRSYSRKTDTVGRWGGEEFVIISPQTTQKGAKNLANNLAQTIRNHTFIDGMNLTVSIGITAYLHNDSVETLFKRVDDALYVAKKEGRDQIVVQ